MAMIRHSDRHRETKGGKQRTKRYLDGPARVDSRSSTIPVLFAVSFDTIMELSKPNGRWGTGLPPAAISTAAHIHCYARLDSAATALGNTGQFTPAMRDRRAVYISESMLKLMP